ncbi:phosphatase PAP2 family protein [Streptomyces sp. HUAS MG91]|uniref:Phosphatase PAP2 family protein n=1 Tax=Streptomyces tabacisoli TaxID=3156398 RepID=A0AAU8IJM4_9ACTN
MNGPTVAPAAPTGLRRMWQPAALPWTGGVATLLVTFLTAAVLVSSDGTVAGDSALHTWSLAHRSQTAVSIARFVTDSGTSVWPYLITFAAGFLTGTTSRLRLIRGSAALAVLLAGQGIRFVAMSLIARPRPPRSDWATHASGFSMPSGHTTTSALAAGLVCWAVTRTAHRTAARCLRITAVGWAVCVALTRIYLGVHWASDILAGWLLAVAWLAFLGALLAPLERRTVPPAQN